MQAGLRSKLIAIMEINKYSEADAKEELARIAEDGQITGQDIDWTDDGADQNDQHEEETEDPEENRNDEGDQEE